MAADPDNIKFVTSEKHLREHDGNFRNPTSCGTPGRRGRVTRQKPAAGELIRRNGNIDLKCYPMEYSSFIALLIEKLKINDDYYHSTYGNYIFTYLLYLENEESYNFILANQNLAIGNLAEDF